MSHCSEDSRDRQRRPCTTVGMARGAGSSAGVSVNTRRELDTNSTNPCSRELLPPAAPGAASYAALRAPRYSKSRSDARLVRRIKAT